MDQNTETRQHYFTFKYGLAGLFFEDPLGLIQRICQGSTTLPTLHLIWNQVGKKLDASEKLDPTTVGIEYTNMVIDEKLECMVISLSAAQHRGEPKYIALILSTSDTHLGYMFVGERFIAETDIDKNQVMLVQIIPESRLSYFPIAVKSGMEFAAACAMVVLQNTSPNTQVSLPSELFDLKTKSQRHQSTRQKQPNPATNIAHKIDVKQLKYRKQILVRALGLQILVLLFWMTQIGEVINTAYVTVSFATTTFVMWSVYKVASLLKQQVITKLIWMILIVISNFFALAAILLFNYQAQKTLAEKGKSVGFFEFI